jgi:hypothetical protein
VRGSALPVDPALAAQAGIDPATGKLPPDPTASAAPQVPAAQPSPTR